MSDDLDPLDALLMQPLAAVPDGGFTRNVVARVAEWRTGRARLEALAELAALAAVLALAPFTSIGQTMEQLGAALAASQIVVVALGVSLLSFGLLQWVQD